MTTAVKELGVTTDKTPKTADRDDPVGEIERRPLSPVAQRALAEAEERRRTRDAEARLRAKELGGRGGPDPVRYGDWENGGIASDF